MTEKFIGASVAVMLGIIGVAILATLVSKSSDTTKVVSSGAGGFACVLRTALTGVNQCGSSLIESVDSTISFPGIGGSTGRNPF